MRKTTIAGALVAALMLAGAASASASPEDPDPFDPGDCSANADAACDAGPYGANSSDNPGSMWNANNPNSPLNPANRAGHP